MSLKSQIKNDVGIFTNLDDYGDWHEVEYSRIMCVIDTYDNIGSRPDNEDYMVSKNSITLYAKTADLPDRRGYGASLNVDGVEYMVTSWNENLGMSSISLSSSLFS